MIEDDSWKDKAACHNKWDMFFEGSERNPVLEQEVKRFCFNACEVRYECLSWALRHREHYGIWGGYTAKERLRLDTMV